MDSKIVSQGKCTYCDKTFSPRGMITHLKDHLNAEQIANPTTEKAYFLNIKTEKYFLEVLVKGKAVFEELDTFLRDIWVECCHHLSGFSHKQFEIDMSDKFQDILSPGLILRYDYDYGSTTRFNLEVAGAYNIAMNKNLVLLSRNEPLKFMCHICKEKPAVDICTTHMCITDQYMFCSSCSKKHAGKCDDFEDYSSMPVVNSPRMGVCGYTGGRIDVERDGVYKMENK